MTVFEQKEGILLLITLKTIFERAREKKFTFLSFYLTFLLYFGYPVHFYFISGNP